ncbi:O-antigen ligase family protein [Pseudomonas zhanjiangensis]|uniref:O-antigen ligase family protein n=1 Tax=Pseudomonas zhanjiangensis TaxID=3239015 RepID=A0ABV3YS82_9PSED
MTFSRSLKRSDLALPSAWLCVLVVGLFVQMSGLLFNSDGSRYATQAYLVLFVPALILLAWRRLDLHIWSQAPGLILVCLLAWVVLTGAFNTGSTHGLAYWLKIDALILLYVFTVASLTRHERAFNFLLVAVVLVAAIFAWWTLVYQFGVLDKPLKYRAVRLSELGWGGLADLDNPIVAGMYYGVFAVLLTYLFVGQKLRIWQMGVLVLAMLGLLAYVLFTFSRGAWLSTAAGGVLVLLLFPNIKSRTLIGIGCLLVVVSAPLFWPEFQHEQRIGVNGRHPIWANWAEQFAGFWLLGAGAGADLFFQLPNSTTRYLHAHSLYLQLWYEYGIVGIGLFVLLLLSLLHKGWVCRAQPLARVGLALLVFAMVAMVSDVYAIFHRLSPYWVLVWFPVGILLGVRPPATAKAAASQQ